MDYSLITQARITQTEFARLVGVTRCTVSLWKNGHWNPHRYIRTTVERTLECIDDALHVGTLPLPPGTANRSEAIAAALHQTAHQDNVNANPTTILS